MNAHDDRRPVKGEPWVWLTGMGLAAALTMAGLLLIVIVYNGAGMFWPRRVVELTIPGKDGKPIQVLGEIAQERERRLFKDGVEITVDELQLFVGNKDAYGMSYRWLDRSWVINQDQPKDVVSVERLEYGQAIGRPVALRTSKGGVIMAGDANFQATVEKLIDEAQDRWDTIKYIEKGEIGDNASRLQILERNLPRINDPAEQAKTKTEIAQLQARFKELSAQTQLLRKQQLQDVFQIRLGTGELRDLPIGKIVKVSFPNEAGFLSRCGEVLHRLWVFVSDNPREANTEGGIFPAIFGTFVLTLLMSAAVVPFGVVAAIYLREYAKQGPLVRSVRIAVNNLAGVPSIVFGVFGMGFLVYTMGGSIDRLFFSDSLPQPTFGTGGIMWSALTLALMTVPVVVVATEEAIAAVPRGMKEGSLALGASKWQTIRAIVLPAAVPGILTGLILAMARGAGEVAPLMLVGVVKLAPSLPLDLEYPFLHLDQKFMHLGFHIYDLGFQSPDSEAARPMVFATTFFLIVLVLALNLGAILIRERLRRKFATSAF